MANKKNGKKHKRLREIEDRRIEILLEIGSIDDDKIDTILELNSEYARLHKEQYLLQVELIREKEEK